MSKLIITSQENGKIKYIEGEEVEVSVSDLQQQLSKVNSDLQAATVVPEVESRTIVNELNSKKAARLERLNAEIAAARQRYDQDIAAFQKEADEKLAQKKAAAQNTVRTQELQKQRDKLRAILQNFQPTKPEVATATQPTRVRATVQSQGEPAKEAHQPTQATQRPSRVVVSVKPSTANRPAPTNSGNTSSTPRRIVF